MRVDVVAVCDRYVFAACCACSPAWALAEAVATRLLPLWFNARGSDFTWEWTLMALEANVQLVRAHCRRCFALSCITELSLLRAKLCVE